MYFIDYGVVTLYIYDIVRRQENRDELLRKYRTMRVTINFRKKRCRGYLVDENIAKCNAANQ